LDVHLQSGEALGINEVLQVLQILTAVRFADPISVFNRLALSDAIHLLEWHLLSAQKQNIPSHASTSEVDIQEPFRLATFLYVDKVLRDMRSINTGGLIRRLAEALHNKFHTGHFEAPPGSSCSDVLLWIFFIGGVASQGTEERRYFVQGLNRLCQRRQFRCKDEFEEAIDRVGPGLQSFSQQSAELWAEMLLL
jgi:Fungal specific transcription factor domain